MISFHYKGVKIPIEMPQGSSSTVQQLCDREKALVYFGSCAVQLADHDIWHQMLLLCW